MNELPVMNEAQPATVHSWLRRSFSTLKRWLREPLLHFLLIGLVLFGFYAYINRGRSGSASPRQIVLSLDELATMEAYFESQWHRRPTPQEFQAMVEDKIKEEVLYREGLVMGLDKERHNCQAAHGAESAVSCRGCCNGARALDRRAESLVREEQQISSPCQAAIASGIFIFLPISGARMLTRMPPRRWQESPDNLKTRR